MPRLRVDQVPSLRRHSASGQGLVCLSGHCIYLGEWPAGQKAPAEVQANYKRAVAEWEANGRRDCGPARSAPGLGIGELLLAFWEYALGHYRQADRTPTRALEGYRLSLRPLRQSYELLPAGDFGPKALEAVRQRMVAAGLCRNVVNQRVGRIKRVFRWAASEELVLVAVYQALATVAGLPKGRGPARETGPVEPVADEHVEATLPHLLPTVAAVIKLMRLTGARCGEICAVRACDLTTTGDVWLYRPARHKTSHRGKARVIAIGPKGQTVLRPFLTTDLQAPMFSPAKAMEERAARLRASRKSRVQPSQQGRRKKAGKRAPGAWYRPLAVATAVRRASEKADRVARQRAEDERAAAEGWQPIRVPKKVPDGDRLVPHWHPHQLRHSHATEVRSKWGLEAARTALGHSGASIVELYAARDQEQAMRVAAECG